MENIISFSTFSSINESVDPNATNIIIGDSASPLMALNIKNASLLSNQQGEGSLWKGGKGVKWLKSAVSKYPISPRIQNVVINIGTNGGFNKKDDIKGLYTELKRVFPNARFLQLQGSWGWGGNRNVTEAQVKEYYKGYEKEGAIIVYPAKGYVATDREAHTNRPVLAKIGAEVDRLINTPGKVVSSEVSYSTTSSGQGENTQQYSTGSSNVIGGIISRKGDPYKYKVENDHWMAKRDDHTRWYEITGKDFKPAYQVSIDILDTENPTSRTEKAPKRTVKNPGTSTNTNTNTVTNTQDDIDQVILPLEKGADPEKLDPKISKEFNFHLIPDGKETNYRSAQLPMKHMKNMYIKYGIKRVIRLNGDGKDAKHHMLNKAVTIEEEKALCKEIGCEFHKLSSVKDQAKVNELLSKGNTLIHCAHGADRTGGNVGGYLYDTKVNSSLITPEAIWKYTTQYNNWNSMAKNRPKKFADGGYLTQAQKFGVEDLESANALAKKYK
jgi:hypothetical protein